MLLPCCGQELCEACVLRQLMAYFNGKCTFCRKAWDDHGAAWYETKRRLAATISPLIPEVVPTMSCVSLSVGGNRDFKRYHFRTEGYRTCVTNPCWIKTDGEGAHHLPVSKFSFEGDRIHEFVSFHFKNQWPCYGAQLKIRLKSSPIPTLYTFEGFVNGPVPRMQIALPGQGDIDSATEGFSDHESSFALACSDTASAVNQNARRQTPVRLDSTYVVIHAKGFNDIPADGPHLYKYSNTTYGVGPTLVVECITSPLVLKVPYAKLLALLPVTILPITQQSPVVGCNNALVNAWVIFTLSAECPAYSRAHDDVGKTVKFLGYTRRGGDPCVIYGDRHGISCVPVEHISSLSFVR